MVIPDLVPDFGVPETSRRSLPNCSRLVIDSIRACRIQPAATLRVKNGRCSAPVIRHWGPHSRVVLSLFPSPRSRVVLSLFPSLRARSVRLYHRRVSSL